MHMLQLQLLVLLLMQCPCAGLDYLQGMITAPRWHRICSLIRVLNCLRLGVLFRFQPQWTTFEISDNISDPAIFWNGTAGTDNCVVAVGTVRMGLIIIAIRIRHLLRWGIHGGGSDCDADTTFTISAYSGGTLEMFTCAGRELSLVDWADRYVSESE